MSWKNISQVETDTSTPTEVTPESTEGRLPKTIFDALQAHRRVLQADRNRAMATRAYETAVRQLAPHEIAAFEKRKQELEVAHSEWQRRFDSSEGRSLSAQQLAAEWDSSVRWSPADPEETP